MRTISRVAETNVKESVEKGFVIDTTFVLFFLAIELGQTFLAFGLDVVFLALTLTLLAVLPYFLPSDNKPAFGMWFLGRMVIAGFGVLLGLMFRQTLGVVLPETFRFLPMTLLIATAMISCYIQFYSFLKLREVK